MACEHAAQLGILVVVAAGNEGPQETTVTAPADAPSVISVGAVDKQFNLASFSSRGSRHPDSPLFGKPNCVAPGVGIRAPRAHGGPNNPYVAFSGTSMATPVVAGTYALLLSAAREHDSGLAPAAIRNLLLANCRPLCRFDGRALAPFEAGQGMVDVTATLDTITTTRRVLNPVEHLEPGLTVNQAKVLDDEVAAVAAQRLDELHDVHDADHRRLHRVRPSPFPFHDYGGHGSDTQRVLALRLIHDQHTDEWCWPVNQIVARRFLHGPRGLRRDTGVVLAVTSWAPLDEVVPRDGHVRRPATVADVRALIRRAGFPKDATLWLAVASMTGWAGDLPPVIDEKTFVVYFSRTTMSGWSLATVPPPTHEWFARAVYPERDAALQLRLDTWFAQTGLRYARVEQSLAVGSVAARANVPEDIVRQRFEHLADRADWSWHPDDRNRLLYMP